MCGGRWGRSLNSNASLPPDFSVCDTVAAVHGLRPSPGSFYSIRVPAEPLSVPTPPCCYSKPPLSDLGPYLKAGQVCALSLKALAQSSVHVPSPENHGSTGASDVILTIPPAGTNIPCLTQPVCENWQYYNPAFPWLFGGDSPCSPLSLC